MKRLVLTLAIALVFSGISFAQGTLGSGGKQLNAGLGFSSWGTPIYIGADFGLSDEITIGPKVSFRKYDQRYFGNRFSQNLIVFGFNGNYHFNKILDLPSEWDLYAGLTLGYYSWSDPGNDYDGRGSGLGLDAQIGARYFFSDSFGLNLEFGGGMATGGSFGITYIF
jgi:outer membrane immunogenic protein